MREVEIFEHLYRNLENQLTSSPFLFNGINLASPLVHCKCWTCWPGERAVQIGSEKAN